MTVRIRDLAAIRPVGGPPVIVVQSLSFTGNQGVALVPQTVTATGGTLPYTFAAVGLPTGVSINVATGAITGTPTVFGTFTATVTVTDANGLTGTGIAVFSLDGPPVIVQSVDFGEVLQNIALTPQTVTATGGLGPYGFSAVGLPTGVTIGAASGTISGTPTVFGPFAATVTVTDAFGNTGTGIATFAILQTMFSDSLAAPVSSSVPDKDWMRWWTRYTITPFSSTWHSPTFLFGQTVAIGGLGAQIDTSGNGAGYFFSAAIVPRPIANTLYDATQQFLEVTFSRNITQGAGVALYLNLEQLSGGGVSDCDTYYLTLNTASGLVLSRINAGSASVILGSNPLSTLAAGDVIRMSVDSTNPAQTTIIVTKNSVVVATINDNSANRVQVGLPAIYVDNTNNTSVNGLQLKNFSCGIGL